MSVKVSNLSFSYGAHAVLNDVSFSVPDGALVNVLGPNGVGKSTLFRCILCLLEGYRGEILVNGRDLRSLSIRERAREVSYIPQSHAAVYDYEVLDVVLMGAGFDVGAFSAPGARQLDRAWEALERVGCGRRAASCAGARRGQDGADGGGRTGRGRHSGRNGLGERARGTGRHAGGVRRAACGIARGREARAARDFGR